MDFLDSFMIRWFIAGFVVVTLIFLGIQVMNKETITNFEECIAAGNPAMESYPMQCRDPISDKTFTEILTWDKDDIQLRQHETEGYYGCFGCNVGDPALCTDPAPEMIKVEETKERYCNNEFEVVEGELCEEDEFPIIDERPEPMVPNYFVCENLENSPRIYYETRSGKDTYWLKFYDSCGVLIEETPELGLFNGVDYEIKTEIENCFRTTEEYFKNKIDTKQTLKIGYPLAKKYGPVLADWANDKHIIILVKGDKINKAGPNTGGYSHVTYAPEFDDVLGPFIENCDDFEDYMSYFDNSISKDQLKIDLVCLGNLIFKEVEFGIK